jgi:hypothetical protein
VEGKDEFEFIVFDGGELSDKQTHHTVFFPKGDGLFIALDRLFAE